MEEIICFLRNECGLNVAPVLQLNKGFPMDTPVLTMEWIGLALSVPVLYAAWFEYTQRNMRDARLLAGVGAGGLLLSAAVFSL